MHGMQNMRVDDVLWLVRSLENSAANVHDLTPSTNLSRGTDSRVWVDAGCQSIQKKPEHRGGEVNWHVALVPGLHRQLDPEHQCASAKRIETQARAKVEHPFRVVQRMFGYYKVRYRGIAKNV